MEVEYWGQKVCVYCCNTHRRYRKLEMVMLVQWEDDLIGRERSRLVVTVEGPAAAVAVAVVETVVAVWIYNSLLLQRRHR